MKQITNKDIVILYIENVKDRPVMAAAAAAALDAAPPARERAGCFALNAAMASAGPAMSAMCRSREAEKAKNRAD